MQPRVRTAHPNLMTAGAGVARRSNLRRIGLRLAPTSRHVSIVTDDDRIERYVRTTYAQLVTDDAPPADADRAVITTGTAPATVTFNGRPLPRPASDERSDPLRSGAYLVDQFLWRSLARDPAWLSLYGCAVALEGRVVALVGPSGTGKTTLGLALTRLGGRLYGDEMVVVHRRDALVTVIGRRLAVRERTLALLGDARLSAVVRGAERFSDGPDPTYYVGRAALDAALEPMPPPLPLGALVVLRRRDGTSALGPLSRVRAALAAGPFLGVRPGDLSEVAALAELLRGAAAFELTAGDPHAAAAALAHAVAAC